MYRAHRSKTRTIVDMRWLLSALILVAPHALAGETQDQDSIFEQVVAHYEVVRQALVQDSLVGVPDASTRLLAVLESERSPSATLLGVDSEQQAAAGELVDSMRVFVQQLTKADTLDPARDAFYELSKTLVRYRALLPDGAKKPAVAYCSMAERSWLQPAGEQLGNPYYGQSMARCGELVGG